MSRHDAVPGPVFSANGHQGMPWRTAGAVVVLLVLAIVASIALVDRPAATFAHTAFHGAWLFVALTHIVDPVPPLAVAGFIGVGGAMLLGWRPPWPVRLLFAACTASLLAIAIKDELKFAFGRTWPETWVNNNPSWIRDGVAAFSPFHGGQGWASFPSGHTTVITAPAMTLALNLRQAWRWLCAIPVALVVVGLYGADYHFVGDILAGLLVGGLSAAIIVRAMLPRPEASLVER